MILLEGFLVRLNINSFICPKTKSATRCLTELFPIYQNKHWNIRQLDNHTFVPLSYRIILKIVGFLYSGWETNVKYWWSFGTVRLFGRNVVWHLLDDFGVFVEKVCLGTIHLRLILEGQWGERGFFVIT